MFIVGLVVIIITAVIIILATRSKKSFRSKSTTEGISITRRLWLYLITFISLGVFTAGIVQLFSLLFDVTLKNSYLTQVGATAFNQQQLSLGLAMIVIGGPLWFLFWRAVQSRVKDSEEEISADIRKVFLNLILLVTALTGITNASIFFKWLMEGLPSAEFSSNSLSIFIVTTIVWFYHWRISESERHPSRSSETARRWYVYTLSGFGLVWLAVGLVQLVNTAVMNLPIWGETIVRGQFWNNTAQMSIARIILGGVTWYFHWFRMARGDFYSTLRQVYFYLLTISGGAIMALVALSISLYRFFTWVFGDTSISSSTDFRFLGWAVSTIVVGLAIWGYHRRLVQEEAGRVPEKRESAQRVYHYLMSFLGLTTLVVGLSLLFGILVDLIRVVVGTSITFTAGWWRNQVSICLALLLVGTPLWLYYWNAILKRVQVIGIKEWKAPSRRIFLYLIVGASIIILAADLVNVIYQSLSGILQGNFGVNVLQSSKWSLQTLIVAIPLLWYHWQILKADQSRGAESKVVRHNVTFLTDERSGELASRLENKLGYKIQVLYQVGQMTETHSVLLDEEINKVVNEIQSSPSDKVMLVILGGKVITLPYQDN